MQSYYIFNEKQLLRNLENLKTQNICAMVKADAYGLGVYHVCNVLKNKVKYFGVACIEEAKQIRSFDKTTKILVVGYCENFEECIKNNIEISITNYELFLKLIQFVEENNKTIFIHLKLDIGMNRYGIKNKKILKKILKILKNNKKIILKGVFSHFSYISNNLVFEKQITKLKDLLSVIPKKFDYILHLGGGEIRKKISFNSCTMLRVGFELFKNVVRINSYISNITRIKKNDCVGYSNGYVAKASKKIAVIPLGYADGINRKLSNKGSVVINNKKCPIIGNVCMDAFFVDVSKIKCKIGDEVIVFNDACVWAKLCGTIPYEILTNLNKKRLVFKNDK